MKVPKQGIQLKQTQTLAVTPQLQQSLKILQCNQQDLAVEINQMLEKNIMLDYQQEEFGLVAVDGFDTEEMTDEMSPSSLDDIPLSLAIDSDWEQYYDDDFAMRAPNESEGFQEDWVAETTSFDQLIESAIFLSTLSDEEQQIAQQILAQLDENYYLKLTLSELSGLLKVPAKKLEKIIEVIRSLDPPGVASQGPRECFLAQLHHLNDNSDVAVNAHEILCDYFDYLDDKPELIQQRLGINEEEFGLALDLIRRLSPYPDNLSHSATGYLQADVFVRERMGFFYASGHEDPRFDLGINEDYAKLVPHCQGDEKHFMQAQLQEAKFFLKALDQRQKTILRVANAIVMHQQDFFTKGVKFIRPLTMTSLAELLDLNESTVSRTVRGKFLFFNHQLFPLRSFFSQDLSDKIDSSGSHFTQETVASSATSVKALIKELIEREDKKKPLTDSKIERILKEKGITIARRTVTKYRESLGIVKTSERKRQR